MELNKIYHGDCLEIMKTFPDKSVDFVITDPPFGVDIKYDGYDDTIENLKAIIDTAVPEMLRIARKVVVITCGISNIALYPRPTWTLAWTYRGGGLYCPYGFNEWSPILAYGKDPFQQQRIKNHPLAVKSDVIYDSIPSGKKWKHPVPKPISFMVKLIQRFSTTKDDIILDPFLGSGTTAVAAKQLGRNYIGIEISEKYCETVEQRLRQEILL